MESLKELLGFVVLTGPLFMILLWFPFSIWVARVAAKRAETKNKRLIVALSAFVLVFLLPFADGIVGHLYFKYLCATQAGVTVYQTVELPAEYWDVNGNASFVDQRVGRFLLGKEYPIEYASGKYSTMFNIDEAGYQRVDRKTRKVLGEVKNFRYWGGWLSRTLSPSNVAASCPGSVERSNTLIKKIFIAESK
jgi:hypothetical protein